MVDRQRQRSIDNYVDNIRAVRAFLDALTPQKLDELLRINAETAESDGFPAGGHGEGSRSTSADTPTERAALSGLPDDDPDDWRRHRRADPVGAQIHELLALLVEMSGNAKRSVRVLNSIDHRPDLLREKEQLMSRCLACTRWVSGGDPPESLMDDIDDPLDVVAGYLRSGYCSACWSKYDRLGRPDYPRRTEFERERADRHQQAKDARPVTHVDPVLEGMLRSQDRGVMPVASDVAPGQHVGA